MLVPPLSTGRFYPGRRLCRHDPPPKPTHTPRQGQSMEETGFLTQASRLSVCTKLRRRLPAHVRVTRIPHALNATFCEFKITITHGCSSMMRLSVFSCSRSIEKVNVFLLRFLLSPLSRSFRDQVTRFLSRLFLTWIAQVRCCTPQAHSQDYIALQTVHQPISDQRTPPPPLHPAPAW